MTQPNGSREVQELLRRFEALKERRAETERLARDIGREMRREMAAALIPVLKPRQKT